MNAISKILTTCDKLYKEIGNDLAEKCIKECDEGLRDNIEFQYNLNQNLLHMSDFSHYDDNEELEEINIKVINELISRYKTIVLEKLIKHYNQKGYQINTILNDENEESILLKKN